MLSINDYNHLKLLYDEFLKKNLYIKEIINQGLWDNLENAIKEKEALMRQIIFFEKPRLKEIKDNDELNKKRLKLIELEKENIALVVQKRNIIEQDLKKTKKAKKILNAYEPVSRNAKSTFEVTQDD